MRPNRVKARLRAGEVSVGSWLTSGSPLIAEVMAHVGFDWLVVDTEHGAIGIETAQSMLQAISTTETVPLVRVAWNDVALIKRALDIGAYGVVVPMVSTREDAVNAVRFSKYPPEGIRGIGGVRRLLYGGPDYLSHANEEILVVVQIETAEAVRNAEEILLGGGDRCLLPRPQRSFGLVEACPPTGQPRPGVRGSGEEGAGGWQEAWRGGGHPLRDAGGGRGMHGLGLSIHRLEQRSGLPGSGRPDELGGGRRARVICR